MSLRVGDTAVVEKNGGKMKIEVLEFGKAANLQNSPVDISDTRISRQQFVCVCKILESSTFIPVGANAIFTDLNALQEGKDGQENET